MAKGEGKNKRRGKGGVSTEKGSSSRSPTPAQTMPQSSLLYDLCPYNLTQIHDAEVLYYSREAANKVYLEIGYEFINFLRATKSLYF